MKSIAANLLKPGMVFSEPVYIDASSVLVPAGVPIRQKDLDDLQTWGVESVQTNGLPGFVEVDEARAEKAPVKNTPAAARPPVSKPANTAADKGGSGLSLVEAHENKGAYRAYMSFIERMNMILLRISTGEHMIDNHSINTLGTQLLQTARDQMDRFVGFIVSGEVKGYEMAKSSVNTAILSSLMAHEIKLPSHKINNITIGALLHDTGMLRLPKEIVDKKGELSEVERQRMCTHPLLTHKIVIKELNYNYEVGDIVLQHHERWDGEGYPNRLAGAKIEIGARIVSVADAFEAMVSNKPYRNSMMGYQAMKNLLADNSHRFDPDLLKAFILIMGIYPIGSMVLLNNGAVARVLEVRANAPLRPKIQILIDENKKMLKSEKKLVIDLLAEKKLFITKAMSAKDVSGQDA